MPGSNSRRHRSGASDMGLGTLNCTVSDLSRKDDRVCFQGIPSSSIPTSSQWGSHPCTCGSGWARLVQVPACFFPMALGVFRCSAACGVQRTKCKCSLTTPIWRTTPLVVSVDQGAPVHKQTAAEENIPMKRLCVNEECLGYDEANEKMLT